jgi:hypothetical protein
VNTRAKAGNYQHSIDTIYIDIHSWTWIFNFRADGKLVDASPELKKELQQEMDKLAKQFGGGEGVDMTKFPEFKFADPKIDSINSE